MDSTVSPFPLDVDGTSRTSNEEENETLRVSREDHRPIICFDMIFRVFALARLSPNGLRDRPFKLPREIKLLRVSSRYYTHAPPIEIHSYTTIYYPSWIRCTYNIKKPLWFRAINAIRTDRASDYLVANRILLFNDEMKQICFVSRNK